MNLFRHGEDIEVERLKQDVCARLEKVCAGWTAEEKEALILKIVQNELMFPSGRLMADIMLEDDLARVRRKKSGER
jgi:hypothetical protein